MESRRVELNREEVLRKIREQKLKLYWVAEQSGVHKTTLRRWLSCQIRTVRRSHWIKLAKTLNTDERSIAKV